MPAAQSKTELLAIHDKEYTKLLKTLEDVDDTVAQKSSIDDPATIKGVIAHRIHWMKMFLTWYEDGISGRPVYVPVKATNGTSSKNTTPDYMQMETPNHGPVCINSS